MNGRGGAKGGEESRGCEANPVKKNEASPESVVHPTPPYYCRRRSRPPAITPARISSLSTLSSLSSRRLFPQGLTLPGRGTVGGPHPYRQAWPQPKHQS